MQQKGGLLWTILTKGFVIVATVDTAMHIYQAKMITPILNMVVPFVVVAVATAVKSNPFTFHQ
jgi:hypothetical protein